MKEESNVTDSEKAMHDVALLLLFQNTIDAAFQHYGNLYSNSLNMHDVAEAVLVFLYLPFLSSLNHYSIQNPHN